MALIDTLQVVGPILTIVVGLWGFYTGLLPRKIKQLIGFYELKSDVESIRENTKELSVDHKETIAELQNIKSGQIAIAETVNNEHNGVDVESLRRAHFGEDGVTRPADFRGKNADD